VSKGERLLQLDGLRAVAFILVTLAHAGVSVPHLSLGMAGVGIFFVLSGMLITGILLDTRDQLLAVGGSRCFALRQFYIRRFLRLAPLLYSVLGLCLLMQVEPVASTWPWHFLYLSNIYQYLYGWSGWGSNLWTLAIEEQYYLIWPWVVLFAPRRWIIRCLVLGILSAPLFRCLMVLLGSSAEGSSRLGDPNLLPIAQLDCLSLGGLLAASQRGLIGVCPLSLSRYMAVGGIICWVILRRVPGGGYLAETAQATFWLYLVQSCHTGIPGVIGNVLASKPMVYLGTISYGAYVLQGFFGGWWQWFMYACPIPGYRIFPRLGIAEEIYQSGWFSLAVWLVGHLLMASVIWHAVELPFNSLKRYFPYLRSR
jgi:peptidoglycan/LPS O-acetylase OafA/YrhL